MTSRRPFFFLRISFPGRPIFIQFVPGDVLDLLGALRLPDVVLPHPHAVRARAALHVLEVWIGCYGFFTQWGGLSVVMFWRWVFGEFHWLAWAVGSYNSGPPAGGNFPNPQLQNLTTDRPPQIVDQWKKEFSCQYRPSRIQWHRLELMIFESLFGNPKIHIVTKLPFKELSHSNYFS